MEEDREFKHVCRFCSKSFPCGRSLGGHMRSHMIFINNKSADVQKLAKKKISSAVNNFIRTKANTEINGYVLRDNPKKSKKLADSSGETSLLYENFSKESGKGILSWKPLFGSSMKSNSEKERASNNTSLEDQDSWTCANQNKRLVTLTNSQSDDETSNPNRRRRSKRRTRYMATTNSSSFSVANNNGSSSVSEFEIEQEQEEVAMSLMMLSRDVGPRGGFNSLAESSDNNSVFLEAEIEVKNFVCKKKLKENKLESGLVDSVNCQFEDRKTQFSASGISRKASKVNKIRVYVDLFDKNDTVNKSQLQYKFRAQYSEVDLGKKSELDQTKLGSSKNISSKKKIRDSIDPELVSDSLKKSTNDASDAEFYKDTQKRSIFECATCNKIYHSYQALGGHRASHKKIKGCFASNIDHNSENSIEPDLSPDPTADLDSKLLKSINNDNSVDHLVAECDPKDETSYVVKKSHECPICLKVFPSGQALGGHKRSHLLGGTEARNINPTPTIVIENPIPEIRNFLDLNLPAIDEEDNNGHLGLKPWWISSSNKNEVLVGLISD